MKSIWNNPTLSLSSSQHSLITQYLSELKMYVEKVNGDMEIYGDIEERLYDKVLNLQEKTDTHIQNILKEIGEPSEIFGDISEKTGIQPTSGWYGKLQISGWTRDNTKALLLGVVALFARKFRIPVWILRSIVFVFLFGSVFVLGCIGIGLLGILSYFIAGMIFPVEGENYENKGFFHNIFFQGIYVIGDSIGNLWRNIFALLQYVFPLLRIGVFSGITLFLGIIFVGVGAMFAGYLANFSWEGVEYASILPVYFPIGATLGLVGGFVLLLASGFYIFGKKIFDKYLLIGAGFLMFGALFCAMVVGFDLVKTYNGKFDITWETSGHIDEKEPQLMVDMGEYFFSQSSMLGVEIYPSPDERMHAKFEGKFLGNNTIADAVKNRISPLMIVPEDDMIFLRFQDKEMMRETIPFTFLLNQTLKIYIPLDQHITLYGSYRNSIYFVNVHLDDEYMLYGDVLWGDSCYGKEIGYNKDEKRFTCMLDEEQLEAVKMQHVFSSLIDNFDAISPITHKKEYQREYYNDYTLGVSDWRFEDMEMRDGRIYFHFGDMSLDIEASVGYREDGVEIMFDDFEIHHVQKWEWYDEVYYEKNEIEK